MAGCSVLLLLPILTGIGIVVGAFMILKLAFDAIVGTIALPLLVVSLVCGIIACVLAARALWLRFHDNVMLDVAQMVTAPILLLVVAFVTFAIAMGVSGVTFFEALSEMMAAPEAGA